MADFPENSEMYRQMMGFQARPIADPLEPDVEAQRGPARPLPVEDPWAGSDWAEAAPPRDERALIIGLLQEIAEEICDCLPGFTDDRVGCDCLISLLSAVKYREFELRLEIKEETGG